MTSASIDVPTFLTTLYTMVDDWYQQAIAAHKPVRPGPTPQLSDSEVLCLALLREWLGGQSSEAYFLQVVAAHWRGYFPRLLSQSSFNRRVRDLWGVLSALVPAAGAWVMALQEASAFRIADGVPVPLRHLCRAHGHGGLGPLADVGCGGSDKVRYYGVRVLLEISQQGAITGFLVGPAATNERWLLEALLRYRQDPTAPAPTAAQAQTFLGPSHKRGGERVGPTGPLGPRWGVGTPSAADLVDLGFTGAAWQAHWLAAYGTAVLAKDAYFARQDQAAFCHHRQLIETINGFLVERLHLSFPRVRSLTGLYARLGAKLATCNVMLLDNLRHGRPAFAQPWPLLT